MRLRALAVCFTLLASLFAFSQTQSSISNLPRLVRFSGTLTRTGKTVGVTFSLYGDQQGGSPLWVETQNVEVDATGHYMVLLGASHADGLPSDLFLSNEARWLGVRPEGQTELPRVLLVSVPYALKAGDAETLGGKPASAFLLAAPQTTSNAVAPRAIVSGGSSGPIGTFVSSGTAGYVPVFTNTTDIGSSNIFTTGSLVGINTSTPLDSLHVNGNIRLQGQTTHSIRMQGAASTGRLGQDFLGFFFAVDTPGKTMRVLTTPNGGSLTDNRLVVTSTGNVGIGTATPNNALSVIGTIESTSGGFKFPDGTVQTSAVAVNGTPITGTLALTSASTTATAISGALTDANATGAAVTGTNASTSSGIGVLGNATGASGLNIGVQGSTSSTGGIGVLGSAVSGGTAGSFLVNGTTGNLIVGANQNGAVFNVDATGNLYAASLSAQTGKVSQLNFDDHVANITNDTTTGTVAGSLAKLTAQSAVVTTSTSDTSGVVGVVISGAGTAGQALLTLGGVVDCNFDSPPTTGDYVQISSTVAGDCHDAGPTFPRSGQVIGRSLASVADANTIYFAGPEMHGDVGQAMRTVRTAGTFGSTGANSIAVAFPTAYGDTNYTATCTPMQSTPTDVSSPVIITAKTSSGMTVQLSGNSGSAYEIDCVVVHD